MVILFYGSIFYVYLQPLSRYTVQDRVATIVYTVLSSMFNPFIYSLRNKDLKRGLGSWWPGGNPSQKLCGHVHGYFCWFLMHTTNSCKSTGINHMCHGCLIVLTSLHVQLSTTETLLWLVIGSSSTKILIPVFIYLHLSSYWKVAHAMSHVRCWDSCLWRREFNLGPEMRLDH